MLGTGEISCVLLVELKIPSMVSWLLMSMPMEFALSNTRGAAVDCSGALACGAGLVESGAFGILVLSWVSTCAENEAHISSWCARSPVEYTNPVLLPVL